MNGFTPILLLSSTIVPVLGWADRGKPVVAGYYPAYNAHIQPPEKIPWAHYTHIDYFVAPVTNSPKDPLKIEDKGTLKETVKLAKAHNASISLTIGGWTGCKDFSSLLSTPQTRENFANAIKKTVREYHFDGVDIDWEYPGVPGQEGNIVSPADSGNLLKFLRVLRNKLGPNARLSAAVSMKGFMGKDGKYLQNTTAFSKLLDYITIMAYDVYVSQPGAELAGPNSPLFHTCSDPNAKASVASAIQTWIKSGVSPSKILLGVPAYGYSYTLLAADLKPTRFSGLETKTSLLFQKVSPVPPEGGKASGAAGHWLYNELHSTKKLSANGKKGASGYKRFYDLCTQTPFLYHKERKNMIVYDDSKSMFKKVLYAKSKNLGGINVFDTTGDTPDRKLINAIHVFYPPHHSQSHHHRHKNHQNHSQIHRHVCKKRNKSSSKHQHRKRNSKAVLRKSNIFQDYQAF